jgi:hypothetical protein
MNDDDGDDDDIGVEHEQIAQEIFDGLQHQPWGIVQRVLTKMIDAFGLEEIATGLPAKDPLADPTHGAWLWQTMEWYGPARETFETDGGGEWLEAQEREDALCEIERIIDDARESGLDERAEYVRWRASAILLRRRLGIRLAISMLDDEITRTVLAVWPDPPANA